MTRRTLTVTAALLGTLLFLAVAVPCALLLWMRAEVPSGRGTLSMPGLSAPVEVLRDRNGVPHIVASNLGDAYFALGHAHAQDRLFQMEFMRRVGAGRVAEVVGTRFGSWAVDIDRMMRTLGLYRRTESSLGALPPETRTALDRYAAGINAYLTTRREALPIEFQLLRLEPEPWSPADSLVWGKLMALQLSGNYREELRNARLLRTLPPERIRDLYPEAPADSPVTLASELRGLSFDHALATLPDLGPDLASNEWLVDGRGTATGKPILANDPHLGLEAPILWYLARIVTPELTIAGATVPGVPMHVLGHNGHIAWGFTTTHSDTQDLFIERIDPLDPARYLTPDGSEPFRTRQEVIRVAGQPDLTITVRETRHGPVISDVDGSAGAPAGHVIALAFTGLADDDTTAGGLHRLNLARNVAEASAALSLHKAPQQNVVYTDSKGTTAFMAPALVPIRRKGDGRTPVPGWTGEYDWIGTIPYDELPRALDPPSGRIVNANNRVVGPDYPHRLASEWPDPVRARRIGQMLDSDTPLSVERAAIQQMDAVSLHARAILPVLLTTRPGNEREAQALALLRSWDGTMARDRAEPLIYAWWLRELVRRLTADELGELFPAYWDLRAEAARHMLTEAQGWCDDVSTSASETCADALSASLATALAAITKRHGNDMSGWSWGLEHKAALNHRLLGRVPVLGSLFDLSVATDGDAHTVNRGTTKVASSDAPFSHVHGPGFRAVYDLADLDNSRFVIATGQSGNPLSPHWGDFVTLWANGGAVTLAGDANQLRASGATRLLLTPEPQQ
ncbi:penicillin acylase family protein [Azospirillum oleiclasticum]|nr:penicillin acylase family protein [Azospirillum oleiclasticum]